MEKNIIPLIDQEAIMELAKEFKEIYSKFEDQPTEKRKKGIMEQERIKTIIMQLLTKDL